MADTERVDAYMSTPIPTINDNNDERGLKPFLFPLRIAVGMAVIAPLIRLFLIPLLASPIGPLVVALLWLAPGILAVALASSLWALGTGVRRRRRPVVLPLMLNGIAVFLWCVAGFPQQMGWGPNDTPTLKAAWRANQGAYRQAVREALSHGGKPGTSVRVPGYLRFPLIGHEDMTVLDSRVEVFGNPVKPSVYFAIKGPGLIAGWDAFGYLYTPKDPKTLWFGDGPFEVIEPLAKDWYIARW